MTNKCAGCQEDYKQTDQNYVLNGNFCKKCIKEVNARLEIQRIKRGIENFPDQEWRKKKFKLAIESYELNNPKVPLDKREYL